MNSTGTPTLSAKTPKSEQASDVPAPGSQDKVGDRPPPPGSVRTATKDKVPAGSVNTELGKEVYDLRQRMSGMDSRLNGVEKKVAKVEESMNSQFSQVMAELKKINTTPATPRTVPPAPKQDRNAVDPTFHIARMSHKEGPTSGGQIVKISGPGMEKAEKVNFSGTTMFLADSVKGI